MNRHSRVLGDSGDRHQHDNTEQASHEAIRFLPPGQTDLTVKVHRDLVTRAKLGGKHATGLLYELALLWRRYVADGEFSVSQTMLDEAYTSTFRRKLLKILTDTATCTKRHSSFSGTKARRRAYRFNLARPEKAPTYNSISPGAGGGPCQPRAELVTVTVSASWLWERYERWSAICKRHGWVSHLDLDGRTDWGRPLFEALDATAIPVTPETARLTRRGVVKAARRKRGRCYHALTNLPKDHRRASLIDGEPTAEVDIHACYTSLLISKLPDGDAKDRAINALRTGTGWYTQFLSAYDRWLDTQCAKGKAYQDETGQWMVRVDDDPANDYPASIKIEYQRQCLFWRDCRDASNPLRLTLRQLHPELCQLIEGWRRRMTPTELSHVLTRAEGSLVVDYAMSELERAGIKAFTIHDAVVVPESKADQALDILLAVAEWHLGFRPRITRKSKDVSPR